MLAAAAYGTGGPAGQAALRRTSGATPRSCRRSSAKPQGPAGVPGANPTSSRSSSAQPERHPEFLDANPQTLPAFLRQPQGPAGVPGGDPNVIPQFIVSNPEVIPAFVAASTANTDLLLQFINANPKIIPQYIGGTEAQTPAELVTYLTNPNNLQVLVDFLSDNPCAAAAAADGQCRPGDAVPDVPRGQPGPVAAILRHRRPRSAAGECGPGRLRQPGERRPALVLHAGQRPLYGDHYSGSGECAVAADLGGSSSPIADYELNVSLGAGDNVVVGGLLGNFTAAAGSTNQFVIEDPTLLGDSGEHPGNCPRRLRRRRHVRGRRRE